MTHPMQWLLSKDEVQQSLRDVADTKAGVSWERLKRHLEALATLPEAAAVGRAYEAVKGKFHRDHQPAGDQYGGRYYVDGVAVDPWQELRSLHAAALCAVEMDAARQRAEAERDVLASEVRDLREQVDAWRSAAVRNGDSRPTPESARAYLRNRESEVRRRDALLGQAQGQVDVLASAVRYAIDCLRKTGLEADASGSPYARALAALESAQAGVRQGKTLEDVLRELRHIDWRDLPVSNEALVYRLVDEFARRLGVEPEALKTPDLARLEDALYAHDARPLGVPPEDKP